LLQDGQSSSVLDTTANSQQPTANSQQPTANSQQPTANSQQPILPLLNFYYLCPFFKIPVFYSNPNFCKFYLVFDVK